jgi:hypothetical protein
MVVRRSTTLVTWPSARISSLRSITSRMYQTSSNVWRPLQPVEPCNRSAGNSPIAALVHGTTLAALRD